MTDKKTKDVVTSGNAGSSPLGDHTSVDLEGSYSDNPDKPAAESIAQVQDVPEGWPGTGAA